MIKRIQRYGVFRLPHDTKDGRHVEAQCVEGGFYTAYDAEMASGQWGSSEHYIHGKTTIVVVQGTRDEIERFIGQKFEQITCQLHSDLQVTRGGKWNQDKKVYDEGKYPLHSELHMAISEQYNKGVTLFKHIISNRPTIQTVGNKLIEFIELNPFANHNQKVKMLQGCGLSKQQSKQYIWNIKQRRYA